MEISSLISISEALHPTVEWRVDAFWSTSITIFHSPLLHPLSLLSTCSLAPLLIFFLSSFPYLSISRGYNEQVNIPFILPMKFPWWELTCTNQQVRKRERLIKFLPHSFWNLLVSLILQEKSFFCFWNPFKKIRGKGDEDKAGNGKKLVWRGISIEIKKEEERERES